jgi:hypothetical protein
MNVYLSQNNDSISGISFNSHSPCSPIQSLETSFLGDPSFSPETAIYNHGHVKSLTLSDGSCINSINVSHDKKAIHEITMYDTAGNHEKLGIPNFFNMFAKN